MRASEVTGLCIIMMNCEAFQLGTCKSHRRHHTGGVLFGRPWSGAVKVSDGKPYSVNRLIFDLQMRRRDNTVQSPSSAYPCTMHGAFSRVISRVRRLSGERARSSRPCVPAVAYVRAVASRRVTRHGALVVLVPDPSVPSRNGVACRKQGSFHMRILIWSARVGAYEDN